MKKKIDKNEVLENGSKTIKEFKEFISRGNVIDLAVGVIIGSAFGKIVTSLVDDIIMPIIGTIIGGLDFSNLSIKVGEATIAYGKFIQNILDFLIVAACIFFMIKVINRISRKEEKKEEEIAEANEIKKDEQVKLLEEIRDILSKNNK